MNWNGAKGLLSVLAWLAGSGLLHAGSMPSDCQKVYRPGVRLGSVTFSHEIKGTIKTTVPSKSMVILRDPRARLNRYHRPGDKIGKNRQYTLCWVGRDRILVLRNGKLGWVLGEDAEEDVPVAAPPKARLRSNYKNPIVFHKRKYRFRSLRRKRLMKFLYKPLKKMGVRYKPYFLRGRPSGMHVTKLNRDSFLRQVGLRKGDILLRVNGRTVYSPGHAVRMMRRSRYLRNLVFRVRRGNRQYNFDFSLR